VSVDAASGTAVLPRGALRDLVAAAEGRATPRAGELAAAGALVDGRLHPSLGGVVDAVGRPRVELRLEVGTEVGHAWMGRGFGALAWPDGEDHERVAVFPAPLLYGMLAELFELGPRPHLGPMTTLRVAAGALARAVAGDLDALEEPARSAVAADARRWRVEALGSERVLEVLDTPGGLWLLVPGGAGVDLLPVTPTRVWRLLIALLTA
jgi:hypothetical protein